jgi:uncharacterized protein with GYD domain
MAAVIMISTCQVLLAKQMWFETYSSGHELCHVIHMVRVQKGEIEMAIYIMLGKYSPESTKEISAERTDKAEALIKDNGGKVKAGYALLGAIDLVLITEFRNTEQAMKASVGLSKLLGISFTTSPAVSMEDFDKLMR